MTIHRFYLPNTDLVAGAALDLPKDEAKHAARVLRLKVGDRLVVFDGRGESRWAEIASVQGKNVAIMIGEAAPHADESPLDLALAFAPCKGSKSELIVQKAVELGARKLIAVRTRRGVVKLDQARAESRRDHWRDVAIEACKQCERVVIPEVVGPLKLSDLAQEAGDRRIVLLAERGERNSLPEVLANSDMKSRGVCLVIGPEGGFADEEVESAQTLGWATASLGPRILRAETACITALAIAQSIVGDLAT